MNVWEVYLILDRFVRRHKYPRCSSRRSFILLVSLLLRNVWLHSPRRETVEFVLDGAHVPATRHSECNFLFARFAFPPIRHYCDILEPLTIRRLDGRYSRWKLPAKVRADLRLGWTKTFGPTTESVDTLNWASQSICLWNDLFDLRGQHSRASQPTTFGMIDGPAIFQDNKYKLSPTGYMSSVGGRFTAWA